MKTDSRIGGVTFARDYHHPLLSCIKMFLGWLAEVADPSAKRRVRWTPQAASTAAVLMACDADPALTERIRHIRSCMKSHYHRRRRTGTTYHGVMKALERQQDVVLPLIKADMRRHVQKRLHRVDPTGRWLLLAVDGSKEELPRTGDHERVFGIADNCMFPQAFMTAIIEALARLLWDGSSRFRSRTVLERSLANSLKDAYRRRASKSSRHRVTTTSTPAKQLKPPIVRKVNAKEQQDAMRKWFKTAA